MAELTRRPGVIYTFYSFKGGVGRSMALANVAALLARWGHGVLVVDFDLEAPGIEEFFAQATLMGPRDAKLGVADLIASYGDGKELDWRDCLLETRPTDDCWNVSILSAGRAGSDYTERVQALDWELLFNKRGLGPYLGRLREEWADTYDFVLIDSRTGISDIGSICTALLPDILVLFFVANELSFEGVIDIARRARKERHRLPADLPELLSVPVLSRDEGQTEWAEARKWKARFIAGLDGFYRDWLPKETPSTDALNSLFIPYVPFWSFGERLPVVEAADEIDRPGSIGAAYSRLATLLRDRLDWAAVAAISSPEALHWARQELAEAHTDNTRLTLQLEEISKRHRARWKLMIAILMTSITLTVGLSFWKENLEQARRRAAAVLGRAASSNDPLEAVLVAIELDGLPEPEGGFSKLRGIASQRIPQVVLRGHNGEIRQASFSPRGSRVVTASSDGTARIWAADGGGDPVVLRGHENDVLRASFNPEGSHVVTASQDDTARIWAADGVGNPIVLRGHENDVLRASFNLEGSHVVTASRDDTARIWAANGVGDPVVLRGHENDVSSASFSPDGNRVVTASLDGTARIWAANGDPVAVLKHEGGVLSAAFSLDGSRIVTASLDMLARIWPADGIGDPVVLGGHDDIVRSAAFSPRGNRVVTASRDRMARIWSDIGDPLILLDRHRNSVEHAAFSPDGGRVLTSTQDDTVWIWSASGTGDPVVLRGRGGNVRSASFSPGGRRVVTAADDTARIWRVDDIGLPDDLRWKEAVRFLRELTTVCLPAERRRDLLGESSDVATSKYAECERSLGRDPPR